jgi:lysophospholipase L1-like esterase
MKLSWIPFLLCAATSFAAEPGATVKAQQAPVKDDPTLPRVLIIGDSISVGYTDEVRRLLAGKANIHRVQGNAGPSSSGVARVDEWVAPASGRWDVIHFNFGLHDIKLGTGGKDNKPYATSDGHQVPPEDYEKNLRLLVAKFKASGAVVIWGSTTPVPSGKLDPLRRPGDEVTYNTIARKIMEENGVAINDLHAAALAAKPGMQLASNVHFSKEGSVWLAQHVAASIERALKARPR